MSAGGYLHLLLGDTVRMIRVGPDEFFAWARERYAESPELAFVETLARGLCLYPDCTEPGELHTQPTNYEDELSNWNCLCAVHRAENDAHWNEQQAEARRAQM